MKLSQDYRNKKKTDLAREVIAENLDITENRKLAKLLMHKYGGVFKNLENARSTIREVQGKSGLKGRGVKSLSFVDKISELRKNLKPNKPDPVPDPVKISNKNILVISDIHLGYQDDKAIDIALEYGYKHGVDSIIINGDLFDFPRIGKWGKKPNQLSVMEEIEEGEKCLKYFRDLFPKERILFNYGNHDVRVERYINDRAPELWGLPEIELKTLMKADKYKIECISDLTWIEAGSLIITHGHYVVKGIFAPVNPARGAFIKANANILIGHLHRTSTHSEPNMKGKHTAAWSTGCLSTLRPEYNPQTSKSNLGFARVIVEGKDFEVENKMIIDYKVR